jgi:hypothetical protein
VDRLVAFAALVSFLKIQQANIGYAKRVVMDDASLKLDKSKNLYKLKYSPFKNLERNKTSTNTKPQRSGFKNFR